MAAGQAPGGYALSLMASKVERVVVRPCQGIEEFDACVHLQKEVWGFADAELVPLRMFVVAEKVGGQVIGAFEGRELVGFALSVPGTRAGHSYLHSHMLAVRENYRDLGLGRRMKLAQRDDALARGIELIEWTFDPLEIKNAYFNLERLGAIARRYVINQYGVTSSPLHGSLPTDRLVAEWWLRSRRMETLLSTGARPGFQVECKIAVPAEIYAWRKSPQHEAQAREVQSRNREEFQRAFAGSLAVLGYERDPQGNGAFLLGRWDESWSYASS